VTNGELPENLHWQPKFSLLKVLKEEEFLDGSFALLASERDAHPGSNVVGYGLTHFAKEIASCANKGLSLRHLQTWLYNPQR